MKPISLRIKSYRTAQAVETIAKNNHLSLSLTAELLIAQAISETPPESLTLVRYLGERE